MIQTVFGKNLVRLRKARGLSRKQLAALASVPYGTVANVEGEAGTNPSWETACRLALALNVTDIREFQK